MKMKMIKLKLPHFFLLLLLEMSQKKTLAIITAQDNILLESMLLTFTKVHHEKITTTEDYSNRRL